MNFNSILFFFLFVFVFGCRESNKLQQIVIGNVRQSTISVADSFLAEEPVSVTDSFCERSAGGIHDFYSEGDYWWPDPKNPEGPYIKRDGESNPGNFSDHRVALINLSEQVATLTSAWLLTRDLKYAEKSIAHLNAWFVDTTTMMNPSMLYAQAVHGRVTGRGIGLIDAYHFVEVARSVEMLIKTNAIEAGDAQKVKDWFTRFLTWMTTHKYGIDEMTTHNNHATCWLATAASMAKLTSNEEILEMCRNRFKTVLLPEQMAPNGSFPAEINRTKPYGYSLFNMDAFANVAQILSTPEDNLWEYTTPDGKSLQKGMKFIHPYIKNKQSWPFKQDIYIWEEWPVRQPCMLFGGLAYKNKKYLATYLKLEDRPTHPEVLRNLPVRHPIIWFN